MERNQFYANQSSSPPGYSQQQSGSGCGIWFWIFGGVIGVGLAGVCCCGGVIYFGMQVVTEGVGEQLCHHPTVVEHIGEVEQFSFNFMETGNAEGSGDVLVFDVKGSKGTGLIYCEQIPDSEGNPEILWAELRLPDGRKFELVERESEFPWDDSPEW